VLVDVRLAPAAAGARAAGPAARIGERAWVRLDDGFAPLAWQWLRAAQHAIARRVETRS